ncbi:hypothetical protein BO85DRAFT_208068 [Aspergillus piperis CBS 112811]|uniref:Uncharacterized protein n=1 Tax=Aspergillus piperis CBS 112811 TaxID=1448313 RepID=A0A8G1QVR9_9EURO|nr:hypothetical protein BO85DRAFT_208068 [Aspergillus piperis CBS 112811]RAH52315.1 hypothetical protein BO85DRAFT_208068 [Aspergillus piperis CBS 112811]
MASSPARFLPLLSHPLAPCRFEPTWAIFGSASPSYVLRQPLLLIRCGREIAQTACLDNLHRSHHRDGSYHSSILGPSSGPTIIFEPLAKPNQATSAARYRSVCPLQ